MLVSTYTNISDKFSILSELRYFFVKILTHYKTDLKHTVDMSLHQGYCIKFYSQKRGDPKLWGPKKVLFHVIKAWYFLGNAFNS